MNSLTTVYKKGGKTRVWGFNMYVEQIDASEVEEYKANGWFIHPDPVIVQIRRDLSGITSEEGEGEGGGDGSQDGDDGDNSDEDEGSGSDEDGGNPVVQPEDEGEWSDNPDAFLGQDDGEHSPHLTDNVDADEVEQLSPEKGTEEVKASRTRKASGKK